MRKSTIRAIGAAGVAALGGALVLGVPAAADTSPADGYTFYEEDDFGQEDDGYPAESEWFFGDDAEGDATFGTIGVDLDGKVQILRNHEGDGDDISQENLSSLIDSLTIYGDGDWFLQVPLFFGTTEDPTANFTTLRAADAGVQGEDEVDWISTGDIPGTDDSSGIAKNTRQSLEDILEALYAAEDGTVDLLAYGVFVDGGMSATVDVVSSDLDGFSIFTDDADAVPTATVDPTSIEVSDFAETGVELTVTNRTPGETLTAAIWDVNADDQPDIYVEEVADEDGAATFSIAGDLPEGPYLVQAFPAADDALYEIEFYQATAAEFEIVADDDNGTDETEGDDTDNGDDDTEADAADNGDDETQGDDDNGADETEGDDAAAAADNGDGDAASPTTPGGQLPDTGASVGSYVAAGLIAALAGAGLLFARRRSVNA